MPGFKCPECDRSIHNRRKPLCEFCGAELPAELLLSDEEREKVDREHDETYEELREVTDWYKPPPSGPTPGL